MFRGEKNTGEKDEEKAFDAMRCKVNVRLICEWLLGGFFGVKRIENTKGTWSDYSKGWRAIWRRIFRQQVVVLNQLIGQTIPSYPDPSLLGKGIKIHADTPVAPWSDDQHKYKHQLASWWNSNEIWIMPKRSPR